MTSSPSTLPQPSHEGDEGQSAGRKTFRPPGPKKALSRVSDAEQQLVARYVDRDTACDDAQPGRTAEPRVMFEQPEGLICDIILPILSICPTNPGFVSKPMDIGLLSQFFDGVVGYH